MRTHETMLSAGKVSVWVGNISSEDQLLSYVDDGAFGSDFDFLVNPNFGRELKTEEQPVVLEQLVEGFSSWKSFGDACVTRGLDLGVTTAHCMVVFYAFEYLPSPRTNRSAPLTFLGVFDF